MSARRRSEPQHAQHRASTLSVVCLLLALSLDDAAFRRAAPPPPPRARRAVLVSAERARVQRLGIAELWRLRPDRPTFARANGVGLWCDIDGVLSELHFLPHLFAHATGVELRADAVFNNSAGSDLGSLYNATRGGIAARGGWGGGWGGFLPDVMFVGMSGLRDTTVPLLRSIHAARATMTVFVATEPAESGAPLADMLLDLVNVSLGSPREYELEHGVFAKFSCLPAFVAEAVDKDAYTSAPPLDDDAGSERGRAAAVLLPRLTPLCPLRRKLFANTDPEAWRARGNYSLFIAFALPFPRQHMLDAVNSASPDCRVDAPGAGARTMPWPAAFSNNAQGKVALLSTYRYSVCPENSRLSGYATEKLIQAFVAGAVPIYWGAGAEGGIGFPEVFNPKRILVWEGSARASAASNLNASDALRERIVQLETNASARAAFFAEPILAPTAQAWVDGACSHSARLMRSAFADLLRMQALQTYEAALDGVVFNAQRSG